MERQEKIMFVSPSVLAFLQEKMEEARQRGIESPMLRVKLVETRAECGTAVLVIDYCAVPTWVRAF